MNFKHPPKRLALSLLFLPIFLLPAIREAFAASSGAGTSGASGYQKHSTAAYSPEPVAAGLVRRLQPSTGTAGIGFMARAGKTAGAGVATAA